MPANRWTSYFIFFNPLFPLTITPFIWYMIHESYVMFKLSTLLEGTERDEV